MCALTDLQYQLFLYSISFLESDIVNGGQGRAREIITKNPTNESSREETAVKALKPFKWLLWSDVMAASKGWTIVSASAQKRRPRLHLCCS